MRKTILFWFVATLCCWMAASLSYPQTGQQRPPEAQAQTQVATDSDTYIIGPEDVLHISVWKEEALSRTVTVRLDGKISLPLIDEVQAAGHTPLRLKEILTKRFQEFIDAPDVSVMVLETRSYKVYISGQVRTPGVIPLRSETSLAQAILLAGGFTDWGTPKRIMVVRKEGGQQKVTTVDYKPRRPGLDTQLWQLRNLLTELEAKYTPKHPDVVALKRRIASIEEKSKAVPGEESREEDLGTNVILRPGDTILVRDLIPSTEQPKGAEDQGKTK